VYYPRAGRRGDLVSQRRGDQVWGVGQVPRLHWPGPRQLLQCAGAAGGTLLRGRLCAAARRGRPPACRARSPLRPHHVGADRSASLPALHPGAVRARVEGVLARLVFAAGGALWERGPGVLAEGPEAVGVELVSARGPCLLVAVGKGAVADGACHRALCTPGRTLFSPRGGSLDLCHEGGSCPGLCNYRLLDSGLDVAVAGGGPKGPDRVRPALLQGLLDMDLDAVFFSVGMDGDDAAEALRDRA